MGRSVVGAIRHTDWEACGDVGEVGRRGRADLHAGEGGIVSIGLVPGRSIVSAVGLAPAREVISVGEIRDRTGEHAAAGESVRKGRLAG